MVGKRARGGGYHSSSPSYFRLLWETIGNLDSADKCITTKCRNERRFFAWTRNSRLSLTTILTRSIYLRGQLCWQRCDSFFLGYSRRLRRNGLGLFFSFFSRNGWFLFPRRWVRIKDISSIRDEKKSSLCVKVHMYLRGSFATPPNPI